MLDLIGNNSTQFCRVVERHKGTFVPCVTTNGSEDGACVPEHTAAPAAVIVGAKCHVISGRYLKEHAYE